MTIQTYWKNFFKKNESEPFIKAKKSISDLKQRLNEIIVVFPDITISEMVFLKNQWITLPNKLGYGIQILGLDMKDDYKLLITKFNKNSYLEEHEHNSNFELNKVICGEIYDPINNKTYKTGETFLLNKNIKHALKSIGESYMLTLFTTNLENLKFPEKIEETLLNYNLVF